MTNTATLTAPAIRPVDLPRTIRPAAEIKSALWFVRRALLGIVVLSVFVLGSACLLYAGIDADEAAVADQGATSSD